MAIFVFFQKILPPLEVKALLDMQNIISEQMIIDFGYHEEIFNAYQIQNYQIEKLWILGKIILYLPESIGNIKNLKMLVLRGCRLHFLHFSIGNLKILKVLDLGGCNLTILPKSFEKLQNLEKLYLRGNNFDSTQILFLNLNLLNILMYMIKI